MMSAVEMRKIFEESSCQQEYRKHVLKCADITQKRLEHAARNGDSRAIIVTSADYRLLSVSLKDVAEVLKKRGFYIARYDDGGNPVTVTFNPHEAV